MIVPIGGGPTFETGPGSSPGFVTPTVVWYPEERPCQANDQCGADPTALDGTFHAFDVTNGSDQTFHFRLGEEPIADGVNFCCFTGAR
jgi:hypothetical protein